MLYAPLIAEFGTIFLGFLAIVAGYKTYGGVVAVYFVGGAVLWTSLIENFAVADGSYTYYTHMGLLGGGYPGYFFWVGMVPLWVETGWIGVVFPLFLLFHEVLLRGKSPWLQALFTGLFAVNMDLVIDPVAVANNLWSWIEKSIYLLGVPIDNWLGWFLIAFFFDILFNFTILKGKGVFGFDRIEAAALGDSYTTGARTARFAFRLIVTLILIAVVLLLVQVALASLPGSS